MREKKYLLSAIPVDFKGTVFWTNQLWVYTVHQRKKNKQEIQFLIIFSNIFLSVCTLIGEKSIKNENISVDNGPKWK